MLQYALLGYLLYKVYSLYALPDVESKVKFERGGGGGAAPPSAEAPAAPPAPAGDAPPAS